MKKVTPRNLKKVLDQFVKLVIEDSHGDLNRARVWCDDLNQFLDDLLIQDAFGTEGQRDPRGDHRP